jgi:DNA invertase Pin-like site-specific DNA recombinase
MQTKTGPYILIGTQRGRPCWVRNSNPLAEFRVAIGQRSGAWGRNARERGVRFGRPPKLTGQQIALAHQLIGEGTAAREAARILNVHPATLYRALENRQIVGQENLSDAVSAL